jgi:hypothetical protein
MRPTVRSGAGYWSFSAAAAAEKTWLEPMSGGSMRIRSSRVHLRPGSVARRCAYLSLERSSSLRTLRA